MTEGLTPEVVEELKTAVGERGWETDATALEPWLREWRGLYRGATPLLLRPATTAEVAEVLGICNRHRIPVVPQGGNTGLVGGGLPGLGEGPAEVLLSASCLNRVRAIDRENFTLVAEAGCVLESLHTAAAAEGLLFPLSLAAEGSCQIGGNVATNAGGTNVLRYGNTRDLVLGLEVVLPDGQVLDTLSGLRKDNTGYDLKQLFIGSEGTLGFITAVTLKLFPQPQASLTAWLAVESAGAATALYAAARREVGDTMTAFELLPRAALDMVLAHIPSTRDPLDAPHPWYVLAEFAGAGEQTGLERTVEGFLADFMESGEIADGSIAANEAQRAALWRIRHAVSEAQKLAGASIKHDVSLPISRIPEFLERADAEVGRLVPGTRPVPFGHLGDGNLHYNLSQPEGMDPEAFMAERVRLNQRVHQLAVEMQGSFSAEHGIGYMKRDELARLKSPVAVELMRTLKQAIDPQGIMNPGKLLR